MQPEERPDSAVSRVLEPPTGIFFRLMAVLVWVMLSSFAIYGALNKEEDAAKVPAADRLPSAVTTFIDDLEEAANNPLKESREDAVRTAVKEIRAFSNSKAGAQYPWLTELCFVMADRELQKKGSDLTMRHRPPEASYAKPLAAIYGPGVISKKNLDDALKSLTDKSPFYTLAKVHGAEERGDMEERGKAFPIGRSASRAVLLAVGMVGAGVLGLACLGVFIYMAFGTGLKLQSLKPIPAAETQTDGWNLFILSTLITLMVYGGGGVIAGIGMSAFPQADETLLGVIGFFVGIVAMYLILRRLKWAHRPMLGQLYTKEMPVGKQVLIGVMAAFANLPIMAVMVAALMQLIKQQGASHPVNDMFADGVGPVQIIAIFLLAAVSAPLWEEVVFRGLMFPGLSKILKSPIWGAVLSSVIFAAIHPQGPVMIPVLGWLAFMGCMISMYTKSLIASTVMHAVHNGALVVMMVVLFA